MLLIDCIEAGVAVDEFDIMCVMDKAYSIVGYAQRQASIHYHNRNILFLNMVSRIGDKKLKQPSQLFASIYDKKPDQLPQLTSDELNELFAVREKKQWIHRGSIK